MTEQPDSCANCRWARPMHAADPTKPVTRARVAADVLNQQFDSTISCHRFPQAVVNSVTYWCGEHLPAPVNRSDR